MSCNGIYEKLLSKLFVKSLELSVESTSLDKKAAPTNTPAKIELNKKDSTQLLHEISSTVFSNLEAKDVEIDTREVMKSQNSEEIHTIKEKSTPATNFSNGSERSATKNSNADEIHQIGLNLVNISGVDAIDHENFSKCVQNPLISMGRVGYSSKLGIIEVTKRV